MSVMAPGDPRHGTDNGYRNLGCRCADCQRGHALWMQEARQRRAARLAADDPRHGLENTYLNHACRCGPCRAAHTAARGERARP